MKKYEISHEVFCQTEFLFVIRFILLFQMSLVKGYFQKLFRVNLPDGRIRQQAYEQITRSLNRAFALPSLRAYASTLSIQGLLVKAVEMFVGSRAVPKNIQLSRHLIEVAQQRTNNPRQLDEIQYYKYFFIRIEAFRTGKVQEFNMTSEVLNRLAEQKEHPQSCVYLIQRKYLAGKQILNVASTTPDPKERKQMLQLAAFYFEKSLTDSNYGGLYYLGEIFRNQEYSSIKQEQYIDFFNYGAALGDPLCYFRLSQIYLNRQDIKLYLQYLKLAAESGVIQAQHNFACEYLQGKNLEKDEVKALAWFIHASANGYIESKFNVVQLFLHGSTCGRIKRNPKVALVKLQELRSTGENVDQKIKELLENEDIKKLMQEKESKERQK